MATSARRAVLVLHEKIVRDDGAIVALIERRSDQRVEVVWDVVAAGMRLAA